MNNQNTEWKPGTAIVCYKKQLEKNEIDDGIRHEVEAGNGAIDSANNLLASIGGDSVVGSRMMSIRVATITTGETKQVWLGKLFYV